MAKKKAASKLPKSREHTPDDVYAKLVLILQNNKAKYFGMPIDKIKAAASQALGGAYFSDGKLRHALSANEIEFKPKSPVRYGVRRPSQLIASAMFRALQEISLRLGLGNVGPGTANGVAAEVLRLIYRQQTAQAAKMLDDAVDVNVYVADFLARQEEQLDDDDDDDNEEGEWEEEDEEYGDEYEEEEDGGEEDEDAEEDDGSDDNDDDDNDAGDTANIDDKGPDDSDGGGIKRKLKSTKNDDGDEPLETRFKPAGKPRQTRIFED